MRSMRSHLVCFLAIFFSIAFSVSAESPAPDYVKSEEPISITVQGASIPTGVKEIASSVTVIGRNEIDERQATHFSDLLDVVPGISASGGSNRPRFFQIRGIGEFEQYEGAPNPSVGVLIDDIDLSGIGGVGSLFDVDQVEILRGPQPIRFGANALAGIVNLRSSDPTPDWTNSGTVSLANDEYRSVGVALGGPVLKDEDALLFRASFSNTTSNGFRNNLYLSRDNTQGRDENTARFKLRARPADDLTIDLNTLFIHYNNGYDAFTIDNDFTTESDKPGEDDQTTVGSALRIQYEINAHTQVQSVATISRTSINYSYDGDWGSNEFWGQYAPYDYFSSTNRIRRTISEDLRLASSDANFVRGENVKWLGGAYMQGLQEDGDIKQYSDGLVYDYLGSAYHAKTYALFGQYEVPVAQRTGLTFGVREEIRDASYDDSRLNSFSPVDTMTGGFVSLTHDLSELQQLYLVGSRGFKAGGFNVSPNVPRERKTFDPEYLWNIEAGTKSSLLEKTLDLNFSAFSMFRREQQIKLAIQTDPTDPLAFTYLTDNAARGWNVGAEFDSALHITPWSELFLSGSLLDTKFTSVPAEDNYLAGRQQSYASPWQYAAGVKVNFTEAWYARLDMTGRAAYYFDDSNNEKSNPYYLVNAAVGYNHENWSVSLWGKNIFDERYDVRGFFFGNEPPNYENKRYVQLGDRALCGITLAYHF